MSKILKLSVLLVAVAVALPVFAADDEPPTLARSYTLKVTSGHQAEFEAGVKKQMEWYKKHDETWNWHLWQYETGRDIGTYIFRSPSHTWEDFDGRAERGSEARAHFMENVAPHLDSIHGEIGEVLYKVSHWPEDFGDVPMVSVYEFALHYGMTEQFIHTIGKIHEAIEKTEWPANYAWGVTVSGGEVGTFWLVIPMKSWADMKGPDQPFNAMLEEAMGRSDADAIMQSMRECVRESHNSVMRLRTDLSYMPSE